MKNIIKYSGILEEKIDEALQLLINIGIFLLFLGSCIISTYLFQSTHAEYNLKLDKIVNNIYMPLTSIDEVQNQYITKLWLYIFAAFISAGLFFHSLSVWIDDNEDNIYLKILKTPFELLTDRIVEIIESTDWYWALDRKLEKEEPSGNPNSELMKTYPVQYLKPLPFLATQEKKNRERQLELELIRLNQQAEQEAYRKSLNENNSDDSLSNRRSKDTDVIIVDEETTEDSGR